MTRRRRRGRATARRTARRSGGRRRTGGATGRRPGAGRRRALLALGAVALVAGMLVSIRRGAEGRRLSETLEEMARRERETEAALAGTKRRLDSLVSRERILAVGAELGLRPATDGEIMFLSEPPAPGPVRGGGS